MRQASVIRLTLSRSRDTPSPTLVHPARRSDWLAPVVGEPPLGAAGLCQRLRRHHVPRERAPSALDWTSRSHRRHSIHRRRPLPRAARVAETRLAAGRRRLSAPPRVRRPPAVRLAPAAPALQLRHLAESGHAFPPQCFASEARRNGRACPSLLQTTSSTSRRASLGSTTPPIPTPPIDPNLPAAGAAVAPAAGHAGRSGSDAAATRPAS